MSADRVAAALARLEENRELRLPLPKTDLLGRLALRFLWKRQIKWQIEANLAVRDALVALRDQTPEPVGQHELAHEVELLKQADRTMMAGLNQRLYSALGRIESQLSELRLRQVEATDAETGAGQRIKALEAQVAALSAESTDVRLRHAQLDLFLDRMRGGQSAADVAAEVPDRDSFLELALSELLDGPAEKVRAARQAYLPLVAEEGGPVFDAAPARGEWLEVLRSAGLPHLASSANALVRRHCADLGLEVGPDDALTTLAAVPARTLGAVTAFRFAERLDPDTVARFTDLAATALRPGGLLLVETPAPAPGSTTEFQLDPYARKPLHPVFLRFLAESAGFARVEVRPAEAGQELGERLCLVARR